MKKTLLIALCSLAVLFAACTKPEPEPEPEAIDYALNYVGNYLGQFTLTITSMNNQPQIGLGFPIEGIGMDITKGEETNAITAMVTVGNESHYTNGTATEEKAEFEAVHLVIDETHQSQPYFFNLDLLMEGTKATSDTLNIVGTFSGNGNFTMQTGDVILLNEVSGNLTGKLVKQ